MAAYREKAPIYRRKEHDGFGLSVRKKDEKGFSWEWFKLDEENESNKIYRKLQGSGEVHVTFKEIGSTKEISMILFVSDVILRYMSNPESKTVTHLIVVRKGSVLGF